MLNFSHIKQQVYYWIEKYSRFRIPDILWGISIGICFLGGLTSGLAALFSVFAMHWLKSESRAPSLIKRVALISSILTFSMVLNTGISLIALTSATHLTLLTLSSAILSLTFYPFVRKIGLSNLSLLENMHNKLYQDFKTYKSLVFIFDFTPEKNQKFQIPDPNKALEFAMTSYLEQDETIFNRLVVDHKANIHAPSCFGDYSVAYSIIAIFALSESLPNFDIDKMNRLFSFLINNPQLTTNENNKILNFIMTKNAPKTLEAFLNSGADLSNEDLHHTLVTLIATAPYRQVFLEHYKNLYRTFSLTQSLKEIASKVLQATDATINPKHCPQEVLFFYQKTRERENARKNSKNMLEYYNQNINLTKEEREQYLKATA